MTPSAAQHTTVDLTQHHIQQMSIYQQTMSQSNASASKNANKHCKQSNMTTKPSHFSRSKSFSSLQMNLFRQTVSNLMSRFIRSRSIPCSFDYSSHTSIMTTNRYYDDDERSPTHRCQRNHRLILVKAKFQKSLLEELPTDILEDILGDYLSTKQIYQVCTLVSKRVNSIVKLDSFCHRKYNQLSQTNQWFQSQMREQNIKIIQFNNHLQNDLYSNYKYFYLCSHLIGHWMSSDCYLGQLVCFKYDHSTLRITGYEMSIQCNTTIRASQQQPIRNGETPESISQFKSKPIMEIQLYLNHQQPDIYFLKQSPVTRKVTKYSASMTFVPNQTFALHSKQDLSDIDDFIKPSSNNTDIPFSCFDFKCASLPLRPTDIPSTFAALTTERQRFADKLFYPNPFSRYTKLDFSPDIQEHSAFMTNECKHDSKISSSDNQLKNHNMRSSKVINNKMDSPKISILQNPFFDEFVNLQRSLLPPTGLYVAQYGPHGLELIYIYYIEDEMIGKKVLGDVNVPAGKISFRVRLPFMYNRPSNKKQQPNNNVSSSRYSKHDLPFSSQFQDNEPFVKVDSKMQKQLCPASDSESSGLSPEDQADLDAYLASVCISSAVSDSTNSRCSFNQQIVTTVDCCQPTRTSSKKSVYNQNQQTVMMETDQTGINVQFAFPSDAISSAPMSIVSADEFSTPSSKEMSQQDDTPTTSGNSNDFDICDLMFENYSHAATKGDSYLPKFKATDDDPLFETEMTQASIKQRLSFWRSQYQLLAEGLEHESEQQEVADFNHEASKLYGIYFGRGTIAYPEFQAPQTVEIAFYLHSNCTFSLFFINILKFSPFYCTNHFTEDRQVEYKTLLNKYIGWQVHADQRMEALRNLQMDDLGIEQEVENDAIDMRQIIQSEEAIVHIE